MSPDDSLSQYITHIGGIFGEPPEFAEAAQEISKRGFDYVVFGHTHHRPWLQSCHYVEINNGKVELKHWQP